MLSNTYPTRARSVLVRALGGLVLCSSLALGLSGAGAGPASSAAPNRYIGSDKCKSCHGSADTGDQFGSWGQTKHAHAFETLGSEESKTMAAAKGIADATTADGCVRCHVTAFGVADEELKKGFDRAKGIQCETCHGPGEAHQKARLAAAAKGQAEGYVQVPADEIVTDATEALCKTCHNEESPSYKPFCFHEFNAQFRHLNPKKPRTEVDIGTCSCPKCAGGCPESHEAFKKP